MAQVVELRFRPEGRAGDTVQLVMGPPLIVGVRVQAVVLSVEAMKGCVWVELP